MAAFPTPMRRVMPIRHTTAMRPTAISAGGVDGAGAGAVGEAGITTGTDDADGMAAGDMAAVGADMRVVGVIAEDSRMAAVGAMPAVSMTAVSMAAVSMAAAVMEVEAMAEVATDMDSLRR